MSSSKSPHQPTRQQLDELEALMQRMLALPVNQLDGGRSDPPLPALAPIDMPSDWDSDIPSATANEPALPAREQAAATLHLAGPKLGPAEAGKSSAEPPDTLEKPRYPAPRREYATDHEVDQNLDPLPANVTVVARPASTERPWQFPLGTRHTPLPLRPFVWSNRLFDRWVGHFGKPGRWLRGPRGRGWIGWSGVLMLVGAAAWAWLEWLGWTW